MNADQFSRGVVEMERRLSLNDLPDHLLTLILNRILDLKCLCVCSLVSKRFSSLILLHVNSVSFSVPHHTPTDPILTPATEILELFVNGIPSDISIKFSPLHSMISSLYGDFFHSAAYFLADFKSVSSLHLALPSSPHRRYPNPNDDFLFKWTAKFGATIDTFVFLSASSIRVGTESNFDEQEQEKDQEQEQEDPLLSDELLLHRVELAFECLRDVFVRHRMIRLFIKEHTLLNNITITDSENQGSLSLKDSKVVDTRNRLKLRSPAVISELKRIQFPVSVQKWHVPVLKLPVSRKVMVSATLVVMEMVDQRRDWGHDDAAAISSLFSEQGEDEFAEAIVEMMVTHKNSFEMILENKALSNPYCDLSIVNARNGISSRSASRSWGRRCML